MGAILTTLEILFVIVAILVSIIWIHFELPIRKLKKLTYRIPGPKGLAILRTINDIIHVGPGVLEYFMECTVKYGSVIRIPQIGRLIIAVTDVEDIEVILRDPEIIDKPSLMRKFVKPWLGDGLLFSSGSYWKHQRKLITPTFHFTVLEKFFEVFNEQGDILINVLKEKADTKTNIDIFPNMKAFALDVICETAMGTKLHSQTRLVQNEYVAAVNEMQRIFIERMYKPLEQVDFIFPFTQNGRIQKEAVKILKKTSDEIICQRREELLSRHSSCASNINNENSVGTKKRLAFLDLLLQAKNPDGTPLTNKQISDEVASFTFAGHDTTSIQLSLLFYVLSKHPNIQEEIYKEQCTIFMGENREPTFKEVQEMQYLERTIKETQRHYTIVPIFSRYIHQDITLKTNNYIVPKGATIIVFTQPLHKNPKIYPNPEKFDPDRFLPENIRQRNSFAFLPFSAGSRNCLGQKYAMLQMKTTTSKIIRNFKILPAYEEDGAPYEPDLKLYIVMTVLNGIKIRLTPRK